MLSALFVLMQCTFTASALWQTDLGRSCLSTRYCLNNHVGVNATACDEN